MTCPAVVIAGGGQPLNTDLKAFGNVCKTLYNIDRDDHLQCSHHNEEVQRLYKEFWAASGEKSHHLLHSTILTVRRIVGMILNPRTSYIRTIKERCRMCYTCVRECPAKAIRIADGRRKCLRIGASVAGIVFGCAARVPSSVRTFDEVRELLPALLRWPRVLRRRFPRNFRKWIIRFLWE